MLKILQFKHLMFPRLWIIYGFMRFYKTLHSFLFTFYKKNLNFWWFYCVSKYLSVIFWLEHLSPCKPLSGIMKSAGTGSGAATLPPLIYCITNKGNKYTTESYYMTVPLFCKQHCIWPPLWCVIFHSTFKYGYLNRLQTLLIFKLRFDNILYSPLLLLCNKTLWYHSSLEFLFCFFILIKKTDKSSHLISGLESHTGHCISRQNLGVFWSAGLEIPAMTDGIPSASSWAPALKAGCTPTSALDASSG